MKEQLQPCLVLHQRMMNHKNKKEMGNFVSHYLLFFLIFGGGAHVYCQITFFSSRASQTKAAWIQRLVSNQSVYEQFNTFTTRFILMKTKQLLK